MNTIQFSKVEGEQKVEMHIDGEYAGFFEVSSEGIGDFRIEDVEIEAEYRGKGLYKAMIIATFNILKISTLRSENRNYKSNPAYEKWVGEELDYQTPVWITLNGEKLEFTL